MWLVQRKSGIIVTDLSEWDTAEVRCDDCRCHAARSRSAAVPCQCPRVIISPLFKVSHAAQTRSALRNHHNNCANWQLALKFLLLSSLASEWHTPSSQDSHCNIQRMIRNAGPSSSRVRISPNGCLSFIISPNWAGCWLHARPLPRAVRVFDGMTNSCSGPGPSSLVIPRGWAHLTQASWRNSRAELCETETWAEAGDTMLGRDASRPEADRLFGEIL